MLMISGRVLSARPTKEGKRLRVVVAGDGRVNDLVMMPAGAKVAIGDELPATPVRAAVETTRDGRPMRSIVYWVDGDAA
jgi:hypothetical protein